MAGPIHKYTSLAEHIAELEAWRANRLNKHLDVRVLDRALQVARHQEAVNYRRYLKKDLPRIVARDYAERNILLFPGGDKWQVL